MSVTANMRMTFGAVETVAIEGAGNARLAYTEFDRPNTAYNASSTPAVSKVAIDKLTLNGSTQTLDLTAIPDSRGNNQDLTGLKVVTLLLYNPSTANTVNIAPGGSNGYVLLGAGNDITLPAGARLAIDFGDALTDVSGSAKNLDVVGTSGQQLWYEFTAG